MNALQIIGRGRKDQHKKEGSIKIGTDWYAAYRKKQILFNAL